MRRFQSDTAIPTDVSYFHIISFTENAVAQTVSLNTENRLQKKKDLLSFHPTYFNQPTKTATKNDSPSPKKSVMPFPHRLHERLS